MNKQLNESRVLDPCIYIQEEINRALSRIDDAINKDPAHARQYLRAKEFLELADSEISFCIYD